MIIIGAPGTSSTRPLLDGRIVGGSNANIEEYPYQVSLLYFGSHICGAALISNNYAVTAAHCTHGSSASDLSIRAGSSIRNEGGIIVKVLKLNQNVNFSMNTLDYDISVLKLSENLHLGPSIGLIKLPAPNQKISAGLNAVCTGWGTTSEGGISANQLQQVNVPIVDHASCNQQYYLYGGITDRMICSGISQGGKDACQGDSGGPLAANGELIGIVSWGAGCARAGFPGVYSNVAVLRSFITEVSGM